jgi:hypothetical protein
VMDRRDINFFQDTLREAVRLKRGTIVISYIQYENDYEYVRENDFDSLSGWLDNHVIDFFMLLWRYQRGQIQGEFVAVLSSGFYPVHSKHFDDQTWVGEDPYYRDNYTNMYKNPGTMYFGKHLENGSMIVIPVYIPGHWFLAYIKNGILHDLNGIRNMTSYRKKFEDIMKHWWINEHEACGKVCVPLQFHYHDRYGYEAGKDIEQTDGISCGVSAIIHAYYLMVLNRLATASDFNYNYIVELRNYLGCLVCQHGLENGFFQRDYDEVHADISPGQIEDQAKFKRMTQQKILADGTIDTTGQGIDGGVENDDNNDVVLLGVQYGQQDDDIVFVGRKKNYLEELLTKKK